LTGSRVLVVDDDPQILRAVRTSLQARGYEVATAANGETALGLISESAADIVLLDLGLPGIGGLEVITRTRGWTNVPIIVLTVAESQASKIAALDAGADGYLTKPFAMEELLARMRAVARRVTPEESPPVLNFGELEVDLPRELVRLGGEVVRLTPTEYRLLETMTTRPGKLLTHSWLLQKVWGPGYSTESHYLRVFVRQLRKKLGDDPAQPRWIVTEPGLGYRWKAEPD
jgi:two-component system, OmpR family, KDP operon response regulator KdpE